MHRRQFLGIAAVGTLLFSLPGTTWRVGSSAHVHTLARPGLLRFLGDDQTVREIGAAYRSAVPEEDDMDTLIAVLVEDLRLGGHSGAGLPDRLDHRIREDFERGRTIQLNGWILSVTEARQCALFSLVHA